MHRGRPRLMYFGTFCVLILQNQSSRPEIFDISTKWSKTHIASHRIFKESVVLQIRAKAAIQVDPFSALLWALIFIYLFVLVICTPELENLTIPSAF